MPDLVISPLMYMVNNLTWLAAGVLLTLMMIIAAKGDGF